MFLTCLNLQLLQLTPSLAIYDTMQSLQSPVTTHCVGYAYNLAAFLLAAGEKVLYLSYCPLIQTVEFKSVSLSGYMVRDFQSYGIKHHLVV